MAHLAQETVPETNTQLHDQPQAEREREQRANRILQAAGRLILRQGYHHTSMAAIAREAGVGKGTLYLHWDTRQALFAALILREKIAMAADIQARIATHSEGATLRGLLKHATLALMRRPLLKAALLRDTNVFGELVASEQSNTTTNEVLSGFTDYLKLLRQQGLVRTDLSLNELGAIFSSIFLGFLLAQPLTPPAFKLSEERLAELMAEAGHRTLEPQGPVAPSDVQAANDNLSGYLEHSMAISQDRLQEESPTGVASVPQPTQRVSRPRGRQGGRPRKLESAAKLAEVGRLYADPAKSISEICVALGISRASFYRYLKQAREEGVG